MNKKTFTFYHNPRCSKSRQALALLEERGVEPNIVRYLDTPPTPSALRTLLKQLGLSARQLLRTGEDVYRSMDLKRPELSEDELIQAMSQHPKLIERPILVYGNRAVLGRPPEKVLDLI